MNRSGIIDVSRTESDSYFNHSDTARSCSSLTLAQFDAPTNDANLAFPSFGRVDATLIVRDGDGMPFSDRFRKARCPRDHGPFFVVERMTVGLVAETVQAFG